MRMITTPEWFQSFLSSNNREKLRLRDEIGKIKGGLPLLMKRRNGGTWTEHERIELRKMLRAASAVSPYLIVLALPGSILILPLLAWRLDVRRSQRERQTADPPK